MICNNCGATFDPADIAYYREDYGEVFAACPCCGVADIEETESCELCGEEFRDGDIRSGFCLDCLWAEISYDITLAYLKDTDSLAEFMIEYIFDAGKVAHSSMDLDRHLEDTFKRMVVEDKLNTIIHVGPHDFLDRCKYYLLPDYDSGSFGVEGGEFAEWYADNRHKFNEEGALIDDGKAEG